MKEKKVEEPIETPDVDKQLLEYLEFSRKCFYNFKYFCDQFKVGKATVTEEDEIFEMLGLDVSKGVPVTQYGCKGDLITHTHEMLGEWIERYNELDLSKYDNFTCICLGKLICYPDWAGHIAKMNKILEKGGLEAVMKFVHESNRTRQSSSI